MLYVAWNECVDDDSEQGFANLIKINKFKIKLLIRFKI